jgi:uroporphyrinogen decarboxylase
VALGGVAGFYEDIGDDRSRDVFGVVWDKSVDKDIGDEHFDRGAGHACH